jgi:hypothetical protein
MLLCLWLAIVLRVIRVLAPFDATQSEPWPISKYNIGPGGYKAEASSNWWKSSGLKIDSAFTDVCCGAGGSTIFPSTRLGLTPNWRVAYASKIITSSRNGEMHLWDLGKGSVKIGLCFDSFISVCLASYIDSCRTKAPSSHTFHQRVVIFPESCCLNVSR